MSAAGGSRTVDGGGARWRAMLSLPRLRLASGLILFAFVLTHFLNHALGIVSVEVMEAAQVWRRGFWRLPPVAVLLAAALLTHVGLALWKTARRGTFRMPPAEALQLALGLTIPLLLAGHVAGTFGLNAAFGFDDTYRVVLTRQWPAVAVLQSVAILVVWVHAMIGLHLWLRGRDWYRRALPVLFALAVAVPLAAEWGWTGAAREIVLTGTGLRTVTPEAAAWGERTAGLGRTIYAVAAALAVAVAAPRAAAFVPHRRIAVTFPGRRVLRVKPGPTLLEIARANGVPMAAVCGGRRAARPAAPASSPAAKRCRRRGRPRRRCSSG